MASGPGHAVTLICHPETPSDAVHRIAARIRRTEDSLAVRYAVEGDLDRLRVPAPGAPRVGSRLWEHMCCEIFISRKGQPGYRELNLSPSGEWAEYAFDSYRQPQSAPSVGQPPQVTVRRDVTDRLELDAVIGLAASERGAALSLALSAVIEDSEGALSYWALRHPPGKPDFHHPQAFALEL
jgi:hypothetical protein